LDIKREPPKKTKRYIGWSLGILTVVAITVGINGLKPAAPTVERGVLWMDSVKRGPMERAVNAPGTLQSENPRFIVALASGRVEALPIRPGAMVTPGTVLIELSNPDVDLALLQFQQQLNQAYGSLALTRNSMRQQLLGQEGAIAALHTQYNTALREAAVMDSLDRKGLASTNEVAARRDAVIELRTRIDIEQKRYEDMQASEAQQIQINEQTIEGLKQIVKQQRVKVASMRVVAGQTGQLQTLGSAQQQLELGQYVNAGTELARIAEPGRLKAVLRVPETQAKDVAVGQPATIDLHNNNVVEGHVTRKDPSSQLGTVTVEVALDGKIPPGTSADLAVDGTIIIERLKDVLYIGRPGFGQADSPVGIFKINPNHHEANRVTVQLGRASVNTIEVKGGLAVGDSVIISDMSQYDNTSRVRIK
jgi:HlyD family secretion protein